jgi:Zn-finger nucleic acid-binding protein
MRSTYTRRVSAYRDAFLHCPRCGEALEQGGVAWACRACRGVWLGEPALDEMMREMHDQPIAPTFVPRIGDAAILACPACPARLAPATLEGVPVDRCAAQHGVWFDADELEAALRSAAGGDAAAPDGVPDVRLGIWRQILTSIGTLLGLIGLGAVGTVLGIAATPVLHAAAVVELAHDATRRRRD